MATTVLINTCGKDWRDAMAEKSITVVCDQTLPLQNKANLRVEMIDRGISEDRNQPPIKESFSGTSKQTSQHNIFEINQRVSKRSYIYLLHEHIAALGSQPS